MLICTLEVEMILFNSSDGFLEFRQFSPRIVFFKMNKLFNCKVRKKCDASEKRKIRGGLITFELESYKLLNTSTVERRKHKRIISRSSV